MSTSLSAPDLLGPAVPELGWVPAPRYLLRRDRIRRFLAGRPFRNVLEIGCGPAMLLREVAVSGARCVALETSEAARSLAAQLDSVHPGRVALFATPEPDWGGRFDLVMAFEVLEHIEDDVTALREWAGWLAPGGTLLLSVPAHQKRWNARDEWAGHVRRYERTQLEAAVTAAGFEVERVECYGFPLANVLERVGDRRYRRHDRTGSSDRDANTANSGVDRHADAKWYPLLRSLPGRLALRSALIAQSAFLDTEMGNGYFLAARKPG